MQFLKWLLMMRWEMMVTRWYFIMMMVNCISFRSLRTELTRASRHIWCYLVPNTFDCPHEADFKNGLIHIVHFAFCKYFHVMPDPHGQPIGMCVAPNRDLSDRLQTEVESFFRYTSSDCPTDLECCQSWFWQTVRVAGIITLALSNALSMFVS